MLQNAHLLAKIGADTAENEQHSAKMLPIGRRVADLADPRACGGPPDGWEPPGACSRKVDSLKKKRMESLTLKLKNVFWCVSVEITCFLPVFIRMYPNRAVD